MRKNENKVPKLLAQEARERIVKPIQGEIISVSIFK